MLGMYGLRPTIGPFRPNKLVKNKGNGFDGFFVITNDVRLIYNYELTRSIIFISFYLERHRSLLAIV